MDGSNNIHAWPLRGLYVPFMTRNLLERFYWSYSAFSWQDTTFMYHMGKITKKHLYQSNITLQDQYTKGSKISNRKCQDYVI